MNGFKVSSLVGLYNYLQKEDKDSIRLFEASQVRFVLFNAKNYDYFESSPDQVNASML